MKRILGLSACLAFGLSVACGSSDDDLGGSAQALPIDDLPARYAQALCESVRSCWGDVFAILTGGENCEDNTETAIGDELGRLDQAISNGKVKYDGTRAQACFDAVVANGCRDGGEPAACTELLDGTIAVGGDCASDFECQGGDTYCKSSGSCPGRCAARESAGGPCSTNDHCQAGLRCDREVGRCFAPAGAGDRCGGGSEPECGAGLFCLGEDKDKSQPGNCRTISESFSGDSGEGCFFGAPLCKADLRCIVEGVDTATGNITTRCGTAASSGAACKIAIPDMCPTGEYCAVPPQMLDGRCTKKPGAGAACAAQGDDPPEICASGLRCDGAVCRSRQKLGGSCQADAVCYSEHCESGGCVSANACE
jgi:hypothetical protein